MPVPLQWGQIQGWMALNAENPHSSTLIHEKLLELKLLQVHSEVIGLLFLTTPVLPH
jgi:hypothetical protein